ncbi:Uncharacterized protein FKW44_005805, partial [Caligus rogercresseyi]
PDLGQRYPWAQRLPDDQGDPGYLDLPQYQLSQGYPAARTFQRSPSNPLDPQAPQDLASLACPDIREIQ